MDKYVTGAMIKELRASRGITQSQLAEKLCVSDKTVSKWETGKGWPDITLIEPIAKVFNISVTELLSGKAMDNENISANMLRSKFYVCPVCGNIFHSMGQAQISCHGLSLTPLEAESGDDRHSLSVETVEDEIFVSSEHEMTKEHYLSFFAAVSTDRAQTVKLYPEGSAQARFKRDMVKGIYYYCNRDGLFYKKV